MNSVRQGICAFVFRWLTGSLLLLPALAACSATDAAAPQESKGYERVELAFDTGGLRILDARPATSGVKNTQGELYYELRTDEKKLAAGGRVADPRRLHSEWLEGSTVKRQDLQSEVGAMVLVLPRKAGWVTLYELEHGNKRAIGSVRYQPSSKDGVTSSGLTQATTVHEGSGKLKIVLVSEGYTSAEFPKFQKDAAVFVDDLLSGPDWGAHAEDITILRVDIASNQSGIGDPAQKITSDSAFNTAFGGQDRRRCIWFSNAKGEARARAIGSELGAEFVAVIVNSSEYGGCASTGVMTSSTNDTRVLGHEMGHAILDLADEYDYGTCDPKAKAPNVSSSAAPDQIPWSDLVNTQELPTLDSSASLIGAYEGARYCTRGMYRAQHDCLMRTLGIKMCAVCRRELDRFFSKVTASASAGCDGACDEGGGGGGGLGGGGFGGGGVGASVGAGTTPTASCEGYCGSQSAVPGSSPGCYCDTSCTAYGDCCPDIAICEQEETNTPTCQGYCGSNQPVPGSSPGCYCDELCVTSGDCCPDAASLCQPPAPSCQDHCGSTDPLPGSSPSCYCDAACTDYGDCCEDAGVCG